MDEPWHFEWDDDEYLMDEPSHPSEWEDEHAPEMVAFRAKHAETIRRALALIAPSRQPSEACRYDVETAIVDLQRYRNRAREEFKLAKLAAARLEAALCRVEFLLEKDKNLPLDVLMFFPRAEIARWRLDMKKAAEVKAPVKTSQKDADYKRRAVLAARSLMHHSSVAIDAKRGSRFCKLAALLYGKPTADLTNQCKAAIAVKRRRKKSG
ncbi:hypothetical protein [Bradyrhizobium sp. JYMT SZCCT0428]|uniref:hypothetical protein n=1 Tax=Bradyrhizobium sp. JYMT SZCCT0428 TaxID=2807673 RepID=UPI001BA5DE47|nr:hypothetical protein [Bradyrhizobium sp. JYMT SZCCT0428]MBR1157197.1 hypothetical protein [Bradyrhizobium sp. JYMT SZCCT0428]